MLVKEMIERLQECDPEMQVLVDGYEEGYEPADMVQQIYVIKNHHGTKDGIYGRHGTPYSCLDVRRDRPEADLPGILIGRHRRFWGDGE